MAIIGKDIGRPTGDAGRDLTHVYDYITELVEQLNYNDQLLKRRLVSIDTNIETIQTDIGAMATPAMASTMAEDMQMVAAFMLNETEESEETTDGET